MSEERLADEQVRILSPDPCPACGVKALVGYQRGQQLDCQSCGQIVPLREPLPRLKLSDVQPPPIEDVVYYVQFGDRVKIGTTRNLAQRLAALPHDRLLATEPGGRDLEQSRHRQLRASRVAGQREWFHMTDEVLAHIGSLKHG